MTIPIRFECHYAVSRGQPLSESVGEHGFTQLMPSGRLIEMVLSYELNRVIATVADVPAEEHVLDELKAFGRFDGKELSGEASKFVNEVRDDIVGAVRLLLGLVKYHLRHYSLSEHLIAITSEKWAECGSNALFEVPSTFSVSMQSFSTWPLDAQRSGWIQKALNTKVRPLIAMRHLHRAKHESAPHHKWIDATTAAELAVKEVLCRHRPELEALLLEVQSPPFSKMFGPLLERYVGSQSPYRKQLIEGQETRNRLIHRPGGEEIDDQDANDYVTVVEAAIFHLLLMLYPEDTLVADAYSSLHSQVECDAGNKALRMASTAKAKAQRPLHAPKA